MKNIRFIITAILLFLFASCQKPYEKEYGLEVDSNEYVVSINGKTFPVYVYCSSAWTAEFDIPVEWAEIIDGKKGDGVGMVKINVLPNYGEARSVNLILKSGAYEQIIVIRQNVFEVDYYATFDDREQKIAAGAYLIKARMMTNIPPEVLAESRAYTDVDWVSGITSYNVLSDNQVIGTNRKVDVEFSFVVLANETMESRVATFNLGVPAEYTEEMERVQTLTVTQSSEQAFITAEALSAYTSDAQDCSVLLSSNITAVSSDINVISSATFVDDVRIEIAGQSMYLKFSLTENKTGNSRESYIKMTYRDLNGKITQESITIHQN